MPMFQNPGSFFVGGHIGTSRTEIPQGVIRDGSKEWV